MFKKVLIAEDHESSNISVRKTLEDIGVAQKDYVYYCDDALLQLKNAYRDNDAYDLLITDLYFEEDDRPQELSGGVALIKAAREIQPGIKVLVFSAENKPSVIDQLFKELDINAYVRKARRDVEELKKALEALGKNKKHLSLALKQAFKTEYTYEFSDYDIILVTQLARGLSQKEISHYLEKNEVKPWSLSSIEKRLNFMREASNCSKNEQLIAFCKDMGII
jgi:DNA-binding NarL/FixJ family response regulator